MSAFDRVTKSNLSEQIASSIEEMILTQKLKSGDKLPSEQQLADDFGSSRNMVREAMKTLKERGLVEVKNGSGVYITQPDAQTLGNVVNRLVTVGTASEYEVYEVRMALEVRSCSLAAEHAKDSDIQYLKELILAMESCYLNSGQWAEKDYEFHAALADITGNSLFPEFIRPLLRTVHTISDTRPRSIRARLDGIQQHKVIVQAVEAHDAHEARLAMTAHLQHFLDDLVCEKEEE